MHRSRTSTYYKILLQELEHDGWGQHWGRYVKAIGATVRSRPEGEGPWGLSHAQGEKFFAVKWIFEDLSPELLGQFIDGVTEIISGTVKVYNAVGVFKHKDD